MTTEDTGRHRRPSTTGEVQRATTLCLAALAGSALLLVFVIWKRRDTRSVRVHVAS